MIGRKPLPIRSVGFVIRKFGNIKDRYLLRIGRIRDFSIAFTCSCISRSIEGTGRPRSGISKPQPKTRKLHKFSGKRREETQEPCRLGHGSTSKEKKSTRSSWYDTTRVQEPPARYNPGFNHDTDSRRKVSDMRLIHPHLGFGCI